MLSCEDAISRRSRVSAAYSDTPTSIHRDIVACCSMMLYDPPTAGSLHMPFLFFSCMIIQKPCKNSFVKTMFILTENS